MTCVAWNGSGGGTGGMALRGVGERERAPMAWISCGTGKRPRRRLWYSSAALPQFLEPQVLLPIFAHAHLPKSIDH